MTTYYTKNEDGEYAEVDTDAMFKDRHERWVKKESEAIRSDIESKVREELSEKIAKDTEAKIIESYKPKLEESQNKIASLEAHLRQKTVAAEYGFKPELEKFLGNGSEEEMRKEADLLKSSLSQKSPSLEKKTTPQESAIQSKTGVKVEI